MEAEKENKEISYTKPVVQKWAKNVYTATCYMSYKGMKMNPIEVQQKGYSEDNSLCKLFDFLSDKGRIKISETQLKDQH